MKGQRGFVEATKLGKITNTTTMRFKKRLTNLMVKKFVMKVQTLLNYIYRGDCIEALISRIYGKFGDENGTFCMVLYRCEKWLSKIVFYLFMLLVVRVLQFIVPILQVVFHFII